MKNLILSLISLISLGGFATSEDYQCQNDSGCPADHTVNGEVVTENFRKGDLLSTEAGWIISPENGWVKIHGKNSNISAVGTNYRITVYTVHGRPVLTVIEWF